MLHFLQNCFILLEQFQATFNEAFKSTSRYLDALLNMNSIYFESIIDQIYPIKLQLNKFNSSDTEASFWI